MANLLDNILARYEEIGGTRAWFGFGKPEDPVKFKQAAIETLPKLSEDLRNTAPNARYGLLRKELSSLSPHEPGINKLLTSIDNAGGQVQGALSNAIAYNPEFSNHLVNSLGGEHSMSAALKTIDPEDRGPLSDILNRIANDGIDGKTGQGFDKLDKALSSAIIYSKTEKALIEAKQAREDALKDDPNADTSEFDKNITRLSANEQAQKTDLLAAVTAAGGNLSAFANFDMKIAFQFISDIFHAGPGAAVSNLMANLNIDPNSEQGQAMGEMSNYLAKTVEFLGGKLEDKSYAYVIDKYKDRVGPALERLGDKFEAIGGKRIEVKEPKTPSSANQTSFSKPADGATGKVDTTASFNSKQQPAGTEPEEVAATNTPTAPAPAVL